MDLYRRCKYSYFNSMWCLITVEKKKTRSWISHISIVMYVHFYVRNCIFHCLFIVLIFSYVVFLFRGEDLSASFQSSNIIFTLILKTSILWKSFWIFFCLKYMFLFENNKERKQTKKINYKYQKLKITIFY